jgi:hypothetical protein
MCSASTHLSLNAEESDDIHVSAYNRAFHELDLDWHWCPQTYRELAPLPEERDRIRTYLTQHRPHLLKAYDADFLADAIHGVKSRFYDAILANRHAQLASAAPV